MHDLIYISSQFLSTQDPYLRSCEYANNHWFRLSDSMRWPWHTNSRVTKLDVPWPLHPSLFPIPVIDDNESRFDVVIESIADEFGKIVIKENKTVFLYWSGGIDSTSILVSMLKTWSCELLNRVTVLCDVRSRHENAYFYHRFIKGKLKEMLPEEFRIDENNYNKIIVVDGEGGNQCIAGPSVQRLCYRRRFDLLTEPWRSRKDLKEILIGANDFNIELVKESIRYAPVDISSGYDFLWWTGFNFKFDDVLIRKMFGWSKYLTPAQTKELWETGIYRFYQHTKMQVWAMNTLEHRKDHLVTTVKYYPKKYIYEFDCNDFYWSSKTEQGSDSPRMQEDYPNSINPVFAMDVNWKKYSYTDPQTRYCIGKILNRV